MTAKAQSIKGKGDILDSVKIINVYLMRKRRSLILCYESKIPGSRAGENIWKLHSQGVRICTD